MRFMPLQLMSRRVKKGLSNDRYFVLLIVVVIKCAIKRWYYTYWEVTRIVVLLLECGAVVVRIIVSHHLNIPVALFIGI